jgi:hypothetical protein
MGTDEWMEAVSMVTQPADFRDGQNVTLHTPYLNGQQVVTLGTSAATEPVITIADGPAVNTWLDINSAAYGEVLLAPLMNNQLVLQYGVHLYGGHLTIGTIDGGSVTMGGDSEVRFGGSFTESGGRYHADPLILNGTLAVSGNSYADLSGAPLKGAGTVEVSTSSIVEVNAVVAGLRLNVDNGGELTFVHAGPAKMLGTIHEAAGGDV